MKDSLIKRICSIVLAIVLAAGMLHGSSMTVQADYEDGQECWSCDHYHWDEYCCGTCGACSAECSSPDCFMATHCNECGKCKNEDQGFCEECRTCSDCHFDNGWHCILCEQCYFTNSEEELCGKCWLCADCRGGLCDTCGFCAECWASEDDNMHCPECQNCYSAYEQCPNESNNHCVECCVFCEQCDECLYEEGLELCDECGLCEICCEMAAQEEDCVCGEYCVESSEWFEHLCMECGVPYCQAEQCEICGLCEDCCFSASECMDEPPMCAEDTEYSDHFCEDCGNCFHEDEQCESCYAAGELRCIECCRILTEDAGCDCGTYCLNESGFEEHVYGYHAGGGDGSHEAVPKSEWNMDVYGHWHDCRFCIEHGQLEYNPHNLNKYGVCVDCGFDSYAKIIFLKQPKSRVVKVTDHNAYEGEPLNIEDNQVTFIVAAMDQTGTAEFSYQWYYQVNGTDENNWRELDDDTNYWTDPKKDSFSTVSGAKKATLKISVPEDVCCYTYYYRCVVSAMIDGKMETIKSAAAALRSPHIYKGKYVPIADEYTKVLFQPNPEDNIAMRETVIHQRYCIGDGCEEYKEEGHNYSKETKSYINWGPNAYGEWVGDQCEYIEYTCMDCEAKRYVRAHDHYFYDLETGDVDVDYTYENSSSHQLKCLHQGCSKTTREPHVFMAWQIMGTPYGNDGIGTAYKECQLCSYQYTKKLQMYDPEDEKNVTAEWTIDNDLIYVQYGSASSDLFRKGDEVYVTFAPTVNDKQEYIKMENPVCEDWYIYYDADTKDDKRVNVTSDFNVEKISGQPKWKVSLKTSEIVQENIKKWYTGGGVLIFEPIIDDQECSHGHGTRITGAYEPVCIYDGYTGDKVCEDCGHVVEYGETIPGGEHHEGELVLNPLTKREADCNHRGYTGTSRCTVCKKPVPGRSTPRVHKETYLSGYVPPTCYEFGYSGDLYCSGQDCGEMIQEGNLLAPEHQNVSIVGYVAPSAGVNGYSGDLICDDCDLVIRYGYTIPADRVITEVAIEDVEWPVTGAAPDYQVTIDPEAKYKVDSFSTENVKQGISWFCINGAYDNEKVYPEDTFKRRISYRCRIVLEKKSTYAFSSDALITVNGEPAAAEISNDGQYMFVEYTFPYTKAAAVSKITLNMPEPVPGKQFTGEFDYNGEILSLDEFGVRDDSGNSLAQGDYFEDGKVYTYFFQFVPLVNEYTGWKEACTFAETVTVTVNGKQVKEVHVEPPLPNSSAEYGAVWFECTFPWEDQVMRLSGATRYETGYKVADELKTVLGVDKFDAVVVATGKNFADALSGSYLAVEKNAPILLTNGKADNIAALHTYIRNNVKPGAPIYILGGTAAVPAGVETIDGYTVKRLSGSNRYETNLKILEEAGYQGKDFVVSTGKNFADSLSASAVKLPVLLVKSELTELQKELLSKTSGSQFYIVGGSGAVGYDIENALRTYGNVERIYGSSRYETSAAVSKIFFTNADYAVLADAKGFPDGLCGGPLAAAMNAPLLLTADGKINAAAEYAQQKQINSGYVLGGTSRISDASVRGIFDMKQNQLIILK